MIQYALNEWLTLEGSRFIADETGVELDRGADRPDLTFKVDYLPTATPPVIAGERKMQETQASVQAFLSAPRASRRPFITPPGGEGPSFLKAIPSS